MHAIDVVLEDRLPTASGHRTAIADADGTLEQIVADARGKFVLVKPDRYIAAVFAAEEVSAVAAELSRWLRVPGPVPVSAENVLDEVAGTPPGIRLESA